MTLLASIHNHLLRAIANKVDASNVIVNVSKLNVNAPHSVFAVIVRIMRATRWGKNSWLNFDRKNNWLKPKILGSLAAAQNLDAAKVTVSASKRIYLVPINVAVSDVWIKMRMTKIVKGLTTTTAIARWPLRSRKLNPYKYQAQNFSRHLRSWKPHSSRRKLS